MHAVVCVCLTPNVAYTEWPQAKLLDIAASIILHLNETQRDKRIAMTGDI